MFIFRRLKINQVSHEFILEFSTVAHMYNNSSCCTAEVTFLSLAVGAFHRNPDFSNILQRRHFTSVSNRAYTANTQRKPFKDLFHFTYSQYTYRFIPHILSIYGQIHSAYSQYKYGFISFIG
jgi:hypothetical protein